MLLSHLEPVQQSIVDFVPDSPFHQSGQEPIVAEQRVTLDEPPSVVRAVLRDLAKLLRSQSVKGESLSM